MDPTAINYNPTATLPGECVGTVSGCLDPDALNFYKGANTDSGTCAYGGCTDSSRPTTTQPPRLTTMNGDSRVSLGICPLFFWSRL